MLYVRHMEVNYGMSNSKIILERLKTLRLSKELPQDYIASRLGIDRTTYVRKERGLIPITTDEWVKVADAIGVEPATFFRVRSVSNSPGVSKVSDEATLVNLYRSLNREEKDDLVACLKLLLKGVRRKMVQDALKRLKEG